MKSFFKILIPFCLLLSASSIKAQQKVRVLLAKQDSTPIAQAHIINYSLKTGTVSESNGTFMLSPNNTDTIAISCIGYKTLRIIANELPDTIYLVERNYFLELYNVMPYKTFEEFKEAFVKLELRDTFKHINPTIYLSKEALVQAYNEAQMGIIIPLDFSSFGKRAKDKAHVEELIEQEEFEAFLATKFNPKLVKRITNIDDNNTLDDFMKYCDFSNAYLAFNDNYTIITQTFECYEEYISLALK